MTIAQQINEIAAKSGLSTAEQAKVEEAARRLAQEESR